MHTLYPVPDSSFACFEGLQRPGEEAMKAATFLEHTGGPALCIYPEAVAYCQLHEKLIFQRGLEKITATMTREVQMCLQVQFCSMLKAGNISGGKLQFRLGTDPT